MVDIVQQVSTDIVLSDKSEAEAGTNNTKFMTPLRTKEAIDKNLDPFNAMSQSQFEAIRAANNEEFAASGFVHFGKQYTVASTNNAVNQGLWTVETSSNVFNIGGDTGLTLTGISKTVETILNIAGIKFNLLSINSPSSNRVYNQIKFPSAPDGKTTYNKSTGAIVTHVDSTTAFAAQQADPTNVEVVIDRVDMWGFEAWLEEVNATNPFVYPNGLIQSQATTMDGITTSASARPVTYYAVFDGDTTSKGKGINFFTLTDAQKKKVLGNHKNNLYYLDDGRLVQWRLRQRSFAGAGNGDFANVLSTAADALKFSDKSRVQVQGNLNTITPYTSGFVTDYVSKTTGVMYLNDIGTFGVRANNTGVAVNGECYFIVCGTVNRLNSGFYHPSLNANGSAKALGDTFWHNTAQSFTSTADCFNPAKLLAGSGSIASGKSGRPSGENQYFDAIYSSGFGGVCRDMRYSAYGLTPTDFADADQKVKNGTYRGFEKAVFSRVIQTGNINPSNQFIDFPTIGLGITIGDIVYIETSVGVYRKDKVIAVDPSFIKVELGAGIVNCKVVVETKLQQSIGGSFLQTTQYGNPSALLQAFPNGWQGDWGGLL